MRIIDTSNSIALAKIEVVKGADSVSISNDNSESKVKDHTDIIDCILVEKDKHAITIYVFDL